MAIFRVLCHSYIHNILCQPKPSFVSCLESNLRYNAICPSWVSLCIFLAYLKACHLVMLHGSCQPMPGTKEQNRNKTQSHSMPMCSPKIFLVAKGTIDVISTTTSDESAEDCVDASSPSVSLPCLQVWSSPQIMLQGHQRSVLTIR